MKLCERCIPIFLAVICMAVSLEYVQGDCPASMFHCDNGECILQQRQCNGLHDCYDHSDEKNCTMGDCPESMFRCDNGTCIRQQWLCDGEADCIDQSDEENCTKGHCPEFKCSSGTCIPERWHCDDVRDCYDGSDEDGCQTKDPCDIEPDYYFRCNISSKCINLNSKCDSVYDCGPEDKSDEEQCYQGDCAESMFRCDNGTCIRQQWLCDGEADCIDQSDEENCTKDPCDIEPDYYFRCNISSKCINLNSKCDSVYDCGPEDKSDEEQCYQEPNQPPSIYDQPPDVMYFIPGEATELKCIAEGMPIPKYRWTKNNIEFKPDDTDNGRIVQKEGEGTIVINSPESRDEGLYQCSAVNEFGTSTSVNVNLIEGMIDFFQLSENSQLLVDKGTSITLPCTPPRSIPAAYIYWILQHQSGLLEAINLDNRITSDLDGRLHITNVKEEDYQDGSYYACIATNYIMREMEIGPGTLIIPAGSTDKSVPPHLLWSSPNQVLGMLRESLKLKCIYGGNPTPEVHWESSTGGIIPDNRRQVSSGGQELFITELVESDAGSYTCYTQSTNGSRQQRNINVVIKAKPYWIEKPYNIGSSVGTSVTFFCRAEGTPSPTHQWFINGVKLQDSHHLSHFGDRLVKRNDNEIIVVNLEKSDTMVLQCNASNIYGYVFADFYLNVIEY